MRILFIRHAEAVEADQFEGSDMDRPLTQHGKKLFSRIAAHIAKGYPELARIYSSKAARARQTAEILATATGSRLDVRTALNPGATLTGIKEVVGSSKRDDCVALVGHEPDFSSAISALVADGALRLKLRKGGFAEVELPKRDAALLRALVDPKK